MAAAAIFLCLILIAFVVASAIVGTDDDDWYAF